MLRTVFSWVCMGVMSYLLAGCAAPVPAPPAAERQLAKPVYVIPNCPVIAGQPHCYWIEPPGYKEALPEERRSAEQDPRGIAL